MNLETYQRINYSVTLLLMLARAKMDIESPTYDDFCGIVKEMRDVMNTDLCREHPEYAEAFCPPPYPKQEVDNPPFPEQNVDTPAE